MPRFSPETTRLEDIFNSPSQFAIPVYQRDYKWGKEEALELIEDLESYMGADDETLFLGNLISRKRRGKRHLLWTGNKD